MKYDPHAAHDATREQAQHYADAERLKHDLQQLRSRWQRYSIPVQEILRVLLETCGVQAARLATDALDRHMASQPEKR